ncbi:MAG TPA: hypothetical protein VFM54_15650 [Micromonosporaceae bacterium]|nr:hypothetical protein [Micromonosporaceae bacterium]
MRVPAVSAGEPDLVVRCPPAADRGVADRPAEAQQAGDGRPAVLAHEPAG